MPGPFGIGVAVNQPHDVGAVSRLLAADHELDRLARLDAQVIGVADDAPLDQVFRDLLPDAHVRPRVDRLAAGGGPSRRLGRGRLAVDRDALRDDRRRDAAGADRFQKVTATDIRRLWLFVVAIDGRPVVRDRRRAEP